jgi:4-methylaminobutanoate oxidase (formaldehyde-forming)
LFDLTSFSKLAVTGSGALAFLQRVCDNDLERPTGSVVYTQALNARGGIECDFTVTRLNVDHFLVVTGTAFGIHDRTWMESQVPSDGSVVVTDVTAEYACLGLWGPRAREILATLTDHDIGNQAFPYLTAQTIAVDGTPVLALRVTNVGELGWELYVAPGSAVSLWDGLLEAGRRLGLRPAGYRAADSLRLEKGYRAFRTDLTAEDTPDEAGLSFAVRLGKTSGFVGREALRDRREQGLARKLACLIVEDPLSVPLGGEPIRVDGEVAGRVTTGGYGHAVRRSIAYGYMPIDLAHPGVVGEVRISAQWVPVTVSAEPLYDPAGDRVRA